LKHQLKYKVKENDLKIINILLLSVQKIDPLGKTQTFLSADDFVSILVAL
jgi:hypothetical protein